MGVGEQWSAIPYSPSRVITVQLNSSWYFAQRGEKLILPVQCIVQLNSLLLL